MEFVQALREKAKDGCMPVIADIKCRSPREGDLLRGRSPAAYARELAAAGCPVLSVVVEQEHYGGSLEMLSQIAAETGLLVLCKDFVKSEEQLERIVEAGASAVLLIASIVDRAVFEKLVAAAARLGITPLMETHNVEEIAFVNQFEPQLLGINNRDILTYEVDGGTVSSTEQLISEVKGRPFIISESSIMTAGDIGRAARAGADAVLVGTALLQAEDTEKKYRELSTIQKS